MASTVFKKQVVEKLLATESDYLLEEINRLLELEHNNQDILVLNENQKAIINQSLKQIENGDFITDEDLNLKIDKWLNE